MIRYSSSLAALLAGATTKKQWCNALIGAMGTDLTVTCKRDANASATDPFTSGTTFYSATSTSALQLLGSGVVKFGVMHNTTVNLAADLATGASVLRIDAGNGNWIEGSLGLLSSSCDFRVRYNPTPKTGLSIQNISISAKRSMASGTGPALEPDTADSTVKIALDDMSDPNNPIEVGTIIFDAEREPFNFEDPELAVEFGDVRVVQSTQSIIFGQFEFGATRFVLSKSLNAEDATKAVEQGLVYCKPYGVWPDFPLQQTQRLDRDLTYPKPFRIRLIRSDNTVWKTLQMRDGLPINSPELTFKGWAPDMKGPLRPHWNCEMMLPWQTHLTKPSSKLSKYFNGMEPDSIRPSQCKQGASTNAAIPPASGTQQMNSALQYFAAPQWPIQFDPLVGGGGTPALNAQNTFDDPYLYDVRGYHGGEGIFANVSGWDYEPGAIGTHDWQPYLGGPRHDRSPLPTPLVMYASDPNGVRLKGNVPWRTLVDRYGLNMFNCANHWVTDVKTLDSFPKDLILNGAIRGVGGRYSGPTSDVPGKETRAYLIYALAPGYPFPPPQRDGHDLRAGFSLDHLHNSMCPATMVVFMNSFMHTVAAKMRYQANIMSQPADGGTPTTTFVGHWQMETYEGYWMTRQHAWLWLHDTFMWKMASKHPLLGFSKADIEKRFQTQLESIYDELYVPLKVTNDQGAYFDSIRKTGIWQAMIRNDLGKAWALGHDSKAFYLAHVLVLMRQFGFWSVMRAKSDKCKKVLELLIECLDRYGIESFYYTNGAMFNRYVQMSAYVPQTDPNPPIIDWQTWANTIGKPDPGTSLVKDKSGNFNSNATYNGLAQDATVHMLTQYILMRSIYFPEIPHPLLAATQAMVKQQYTDFSNYIKSLPTPGAQGGADWGVRWPPHGELKAPTVLGDN